MRTAETAIIYPDGLPQYLEELRATRLFILTDDNTRRYCLPVLRGLLPAADSALYLNIPAGEQHKTLDTARDLWQQLLDNGADRKAVLLVLGGGVACDLGAFAASTFKRGIRLILAPTTLLAMIDAAYGGKTGFNYNGLKNQIGTFYPADAVLIHAPFTDTLTARHRLAGLAEGIKHALIADAGLWQHLADTLMPDTRPDTDLIRRFLAVKQQIVREDPYEQHARKALNFGHTVGHAFEALTLHRGDPLLHGEAVAAGMIVEARLSERFADLPPAESTQIRNFLTKFYVPFVPETDDIPELLRLIEGDKKNECSQLRFVLLPRIGRTQIDCIRSPEDVRIALHDYISELK